MRRGGAPINPPTVWFNKHLSNTWEVLALLRGARAAGEFRVLCTHPQKGYAGRLHADAFEQEPWGLGDDAYIAYCLDVARRHYVRLFFPGRKVVPVVRAAARFAALGTAVLAAGDGETLAQVNDKARTYAALEGAGVPLPEHAVVRDAAGFDAVYARLRARHAVLCYKPTVSVFGLGFRIVTEGRAANAPFITLESARQEMGRRETLLMEYLPGPERSVDCLARDGELVRCVVRRKEAGGQVIEDNPELTAVVRRLTARFRLSNLFNVQFRAVSGQSYLLEINARMSGGLPFACRSGVALPYWALRLALGTAIPDDIPCPRTGLWVPQPEEVRSR
jgi:biotin carboxylase